MACLVTAEAALRILSCRTSEGVDQLHGGFYLVVVSLSRLHTYNVFLAGTVEALASRGISALRMGAARIAFLAGRGAGIVRRIAARQAPR